MIKVNFKHGSSLSFDLNTEEGFNSWNEWSVTDDFQKQISGIGILHDKKLMALPYPKGFKNVRYYAELIYSKTKKRKKTVIGERLSCHTDLIKTSLLVYTFVNPPPGVFSRIDIQKIGRQVFPIEDYERKNRHNKIYDDKQLIPGEDCFKTNSPEIGENICQS